MLDDDEDALPLSEAVPDLDALVDKAVRGLTAALVMPWALKVVARGTKNLNSRIHRRDQMDRAAALAVACADSLSRELRDESAEGWEGPKAGNGS